MTTTDQHPRPRSTTAPGAPGAPAPAVRLRAVTKSFGDVEAVRGIDLDLEPGEVVAFLGPNGAGKTTTIDMVLGLSRPTSGTVEVLGMTPRAAVSRGLVSAVMQSGGLLDDLTVRETLTYTASLFAHARPVDDVLDEAGIAALGGRRVAVCSGGEQQRLRFAMALLPEPALLLLDEPTTGMDVEARRAFWASIRREATGSALPRTVMFATHYLEEADQYADRIVLVSDGRVVADGTGSQIRALTSGRTVRASLPHADAAGLAALPGVESLDLRGETVLIRTTDSDAVVRHLLNHTEAHDIEITSHGLEEAFLSLTGRDAAARTSTGTDPKEH